MVVKKKLKSRGQQRVKINQQTTKYTTTTKMQFKKYRVNENSFTIKSACIRAVEKSTTTEVTNVNFLRLGLNKLLDCGAKYTENLEFNSDTKPTKSKLTQSGAKLKKKIYSYILNSAENRLFGIECGPVNYISSIPEMLLKTLTLTKKNQNTHLEINQLLNNQNTDKNLQQQNGFVYGSLFIKKNSKNVYTNYSPLSLFNNKMGNYKADELVLLKTRLYHYNINAHATTKYKAFFIHFLLTFLERYMQKKL